MNDFVIPSIFNYFQAVSDTTKAASPKMNVAKKCNCIDRTQDRTGDVMRVKHMP
jgi:hypothetical protein